MISTRLSQGDPLRWVPTLARNIFTIITRTRLTGSGRSSGSSYGDGEMARAFDLGVSLSPSASGTYGGRSSGAAATAAAAAAAAALDPSSASLEARTLRALECVAELIQAVDGGGASGHAAALTIVSILDDPMYAIYRSKF